MNAPVCPNCLSPIPPDAPGGLCPSCVLLGAAGPTEAPPTGFAGMGAPEIDKVRAAFPELEILALIGHGGMGVVYRARQPRLDRLVALKILPPALATQPGFSERFTREARALGRLSHPNIVAVYDFGERAGIFYLMMEFVNGVNLRQAMRAGVKPEQALSLVPRICEALQFAHDHGVLHRDIKPENILLDTAGTPKLADFGIAKLAEEAGAAPGGTLTQTGAALGTAAYMAPEQIEHPGAVDHRADIYSLGVVLYEMLTGELPLGRFAVPSEKARVARGVDEVVMRALEKERERRQQSATEMKTEVEDVRAGTPSRRSGVLPPRNSPPGSGPGWTGWNPGGAPHHRLNPLSRVFLGFTILCAVCIPLAGGSATVRKFVEPSTLALLCPVFGGLMAASQILFGRRGPVQPRQPLGFWKTLVLVLLAVPVLIIIGLMVPYLAMRSGRTHTPHTIEKPAVAVVRTTDQAFGAKVGPGVIEIAGIAPHPSKGKVWRKMDGTVWTGPAWVIPDDRIKAQAGQRAYDFVILRDGFPAGTTFAGYRLTPPAEANSGALVEFAPTPGKPSPGYDSIQALVPENMSTITIRAGVAYGPWHTVSTTAANNSIDQTETYGDRDWKVYHGSMTETAAGEMLVNYRYEPPDDWEVRVVGVTASGIEVPKLRLSRIDQQAEWTFPKPKGEAITQLRFQVRPIDWVEFQNVVLPPEDAAPTVSASPKPETPPGSDSAAATAQKPPLAIVHPLKGPYSAQVHAGKIELLGVREHDAVADHWWSMNGSPIVRPPAATAMRPWNFPADAGKRAYDLLFERRGFSPGSSPTVFLASDSKGNFGSRTLDYETTPADYPRYEQAIIFVPPAQRTGMVRAGIASGSWHTLYAVQNETAGTWKWAQHGGLNWKVYQGPQVLDPRGDMVVSLLYETPPDWETRVTAVAEDGTELTDGLLSRGNDNVNWTFHTHGKLAREVRFQVRPIDWVEFRDIALLPPAGAPEAPTAVPLPDAALKLEAKVETLPAAPTPPDAALKLEPKAEKPVAAPEIPRSPSPGVVPGAAPRQSLDALYDEAIRSARENLEVARRRMEAGLLATGDFIIFERDLAIAEARGDEAKIVQARRTYLEAREKTLKLRFESGNASAEELQAVRSEKLQLEIDQAKAGVAATLQDAKSLLANELGAPKPADAERQKLDAEAIRLAHDNLRSMQERFKAGTGSREELSAAERDAAIAEARGDAVLIAKARLAFATENLTRLRENYKAGVISGEEFRNGEIEKNRAEMELLKAESAVKRP